VHEHVPSPENNTTFRIYMRVATVFEYFEYTTEAEIFLDALEKIFNKKLHNSLQWVTKP